AAARGLDDTGIEDIYRSTFGLDLEDESKTGLTDRITFNNRQRMIIVAESFSAEVEQTLRYLRTRLAVDITGLQIGVHVAGAETLIETNLVVGRERTAAAAEKGPSSPGSESHESIIARVKTEFVRSSVNGIEDWIANLGNPELEVWHGARSDHYIRF